MNRRSFMKAILATATAPYVVTTAGILMPVKSIITQPLDLITMRLMAVEDSLGNYQYRWVSSDAVAKAVTAGWGLVTQTDPATKVQIPIKPEDPMGKALDRFYRIKAGSEA